MYYLLGIGIAAVIYFQARLSGRLLSAPVYDASQKSLQLALIWLLPILGAWLVHAMMASTKEPVVPAAANPFATEVKEDKVDVLDLLDLR